MSGSHSGKDDLILGKQPEAPWLGSICGALVARPVSAGRPLKDPFLANILYGGGFLSTAGRRPFVDMIPPRPGHRQLGHKVQVCPQACR